MASTVGNQDPKKRALEALERRFAAAESEIIHKEQRHKKRRVGEGNIQVASSSHFSSPSISTPKRTDTPSSSSKNASSIKKFKEDDPIYMQISQPVHENLLPAVEVSDGGKEIVRKVRHNLLSGGDFAQKYTQGFSGKNDRGFIHLAECVQGQNTLMERMKASRRLSKRSIKHMSKKELKKFGSHNLPLELREYDIFIPMHEMWKGYVMQMLKNTGKDKVADCLLGADLHGAILGVVECRTGAFTGVMGIMIQETRETFGIITKENKFRVVPKRNSVFVLQASCWKITLHGESRVPDSNAQGTKK